MNNRLVSSSAIGLLMLALMGCEGNEGPGASPADLAEGEQPAGTTVTVSGEIDRRFDDHTFSLGDDEGGENLVVVSKKPLPATVDEETVFEVTGTVQQIGIVEFEKEYGWDFDPQIEVELEDVENYLYAESYQILGVDE
jgi:hypothetical protein